MQIQGGHSKRQKTWRCLGVPVLREGFGEVSWGGGGGGGGCISDCQEMRM